MDKDICYKFKWIKIIVGIFFITISIITYYDIMDIWYKITFISNMIIGLLFIIDGILNFIGKKIPYYLMLYFMPYILYTWLVTCIGELFGASFEFYDGFLFMHAINPIIALIIFIIGFKVDEYNKKTNIIIWLLSPIPILLYFLFDLIKYLIDKNFIYGFLPTSLNNVGGYLLFAIAGYLLTLLMTFGLIKLNKVIFKHMK